MGGGATTGCAAGCAAPPHGGRPHQRAMTGCLQVDVHGLERAEAEPFPDVVGGCALGGHEERRGVAQRSRSHALSVALCPDARQFEILVHPVPDRARRHASAAAAVARAEEERFALGRTAPVPQVRSERGAHVTRELNGGVLRRPPFPLDRERPWFGVAREISQVEAHDLGVRERAAEHEADDGRVAKSPLTVGAQEPQKPCRVGHAERFARVRSRPGIPRDLECGISRDRPGALQVSAEQAHGGEIRGHGDVRQPAPVREVALVGLDLPDGQAKVLPAPRPAEKFLQRAFIGPPRFGAPGAKAPEERADRPGQTGGRPLTAGPCATWTAQDDSGEGGARAAGGADRCVRSGHGEKSNNRI